ncbi:hypothetical protein RF11_01954 [Thelohanellus kitauei]|uniref:Uncharacterized protein n=1 Tax=Thelohanellus kitauei TaxID=669202 RepID=A0A0C2JFB4_THEKT|nr:hypothetical protein RF11_01954 [Thelohanellus kitauei]
MLSFVPLNKSKKPNACYRDRVEKNIFVEFHYLMTNVVPAEYLFMEANEIKYSLEYFSNACGETLSVTYGLNPNGSTTIDFSLRVHPDVEPFAQYELYFSNENQDRRMELEDDNMYLNLHIDFNGRGSTVLPGRSDVGFLPFPPPSNIDARRDCAVFFYLNRYSILKMTTKESPNVSLSHSFQLMIKIDLAAEFTSDFVNQLNVDAYGWRFPCQPLYSHSNHKKTTLVLDDAWQNVRVDFTISDLYRDFRATTRYFYQNNVILVAYELMELHISNLHFLHFSDPARHHMFQKNWIPLIADSEEVTKCRLRGHVGEIVDKTYKRNLVDSRSFLRTRRNKFTGISLKRRLNADQYHQCKTDGTTITIPLF